MAYLPYVNVRAQQKSPALAFGPETQLPRVGWLSLPIPGVGVVGSLVIRATDTFWRTLWIRTIKTGDKLTIGGYDYFATEDVQVSSSEDSMTIPVLPAMQAAHTENSNVYAPLPGYRASDCISVMRSLNPQHQGDHDTTGSQDDGEISCVPYIQDWPWAVDPNGVPWDQANLWALSFYPINEYDHLDTDVSFAAISGAYGPTKRCDIYPVPKTIGSEYTPMGARYFLTPSTGGGRGYYGGQYANRGFRTDTAIKDRYEFAQINTQARWLQMRWNINAIQFTTQIENPASPSAGLAFASSSVNGGFWPTADGIPVVGSRGGYWSMTGHSYDSGSATYGGVTVRVYQENPGYADVLLATIYIADGHIYPAPVTTGTWSGVVLPTVAGTAVRCYYTTTPDVGAVVIVRGFLRVAESTNVPWCHHVVTGNKVAPGGLIAPFY